MSPTLGDQHHITMVFTAKTGQTQLHRSLMRHMEFAYRAEIESEMCFD